MTATREQLPLTLAYGAGNAGGPKFRNASATDNKTLPLHRWVPWIAGFSAQFVEDVIEAFLPLANRRRFRVLDPFAGVGTTLVEGLKSGCNVYGCELNPYAALSAEAKLSAFDLDPNPIREELDLAIQRLREFESKVDAGQVRVEPGNRRPAGFRSRIPFFSAGVEEKIAFAFAQTETLELPAQRLWRVALGATMVSVSNYSYEPSLGSRPGAGKPLVEDASVADALSRKLAEMIQDIGWAGSVHGSLVRGLDWEVMRGSYFEARIPAGSVSLVITSPPYMNNYHYVRNTRPQLYWLGLIDGSADLKAYEQSSFGKFWQTVRQGAEVKLLPPLGQATELIARLRQTNVSRGAYGGPGWANYVATYLNDSWRMVKSLAEQLDSGGRAVIVVGNSVIQGLEFKVDDILVQLGEMAGLHAETTVVVRTKRVGNSILGSSVRRDGGAGPPAATQLYDAAVILKK